MSDWFVAGYIGFMLGFIFLGVTYMFFSPEADLGQMICDDQYGEGTTEYYEFNDGVVDCKQLQAMTPYDGGFTRLITGD